MDRRRTRRCAAEGGVAPGLARTHVAAQGAIAGGVFDAGRQGRALAALEAEIPARGVAAILALDVDHSAGRKAVARGQYPDAQVELLDELRIEHRQERRIGVDVEWDQESVDLVLE